MRKLITIMMVLFASIAMAQTQTNLPSGSTSYSGNLFKSPDGNIWTGKAGSYTNLGTWLKTDSLSATKQDSIVGGSTNQFLKKNSGTNGDFKWEFLTGADMALTGSGWLMPSWSNASNIFVPRSLMTNPTAESIPLRATGGQTRTGTAELADAAVPLSQLQDSLDTKFNAPTGTTSQYIRGDGSLATMPSGAAYSAGNGLTLTDTEFSLPVTDTTSGALVLDVEQNANGITVTKGGVPAHTHSASDVTSGTFNTARLGSGTANNTKVLFGDGTWKDAPAGGAANLALGTRTATTMPITNSNGTGVTLPAATDALAGLMTSGAQSFSGLKGFQTGINLEASGVNNGVRFTTTGSSVYRASGQRLVVQSAEELYLQGTNNVGGIGLYLSGGINSSALSGSGTRMVVANASGDLSTQTIPTGNPGTVTSVGLSLPTGLSVSGSPVTSSGTLSGSWASGYQAYTSTEASKLSGIAAGAQVNVATNIAQGTRTTTTVPVTSSTGSSATLQAATTSLAGVMTADDKTKLDGLSAYSSSTSNIVSGNTFQRAALTGDVTATQNSNATTIANSVVTNAKMANMAASTFKGRISSTGAPQDLTVSQVKTALSLDNVSNTSDADKPVSSATQSALNGKQNTLTPGDGISIVSNVISSTGPISEVTAANATIHPGGSGAAFVKGFNFSSCSVGISYDRASKDLIVHYTNNLGQTTKFSVLTTNLIGFNDYDIYSSSGTTINDDAFDIFRAIATHSSSQKHEITLFVYDTSIGISNQGFLKLTIDFIDSTDYVINSEYKPNI